MKWLLRVLAALVGLVVVLALAAVATALRTEHPVGFQITRAVDAQGRPFPVGVWYPTTARPWPTTLLGPLLIDVARDASISGDRLPLVVVSHGNGGGIPSHADLAMALADAGYVVAAPVHRGDNYADSSAAGSASLYSGRSHELRATVDHLLRDWPGHDHIDPERVGAFGFSAGGFTVLAAVGAEPDLREVASHCATTPEFVCDVLRAAASPLLDPSTPTVGGAFSHDPRIRAAVIAAPGLGFTMDREALAGVDVPVQLWSGDRDERVPYPTNAGRVREALGTRVDFREAKGAGHLSFLVPCGVLAPPEICSDPEPFDRRAFHAQMNADVVVFFDEELKGRETVAR